MRLSAALILLSLVAAPALAQPGGSAHSSVSVPQLSDPQAEGVLAPEGSSLATTARGARGELAAAPAQVGEGGPTAESAPALSSRAESRAVGVGALGGHDRCDVEPGAARPAECANAIETRAGQYTKPGAAPVTPEARLLLLTDPDQGPMTADSAVRRTGTSDAQVDALAGAAAGVVANAVSSPKSSAPATAGVSPSTVVVGPH